MVSKALNEGLLARIQNYVTNDANSKFPQDSGAYISQEEVSIITFHRVLNNWRAVAVVEGEKDVFYELVHDGSLGKTIANVYSRRMTQPAVI